MEVKKKIEQLRRNSIVLKIARKEKYKLDGTRFGGKPDVPSDFVWPYFEGKNWENIVENRPLTFLAQFNCEELAQYDTEHLLPDHGILSFFYEMDTERWGYDPTDKGCARVFWFEDTSVLSPAEFPMDMEDDYKFPMIKIKMTQKTSYPSKTDFNSIFPAEDDGNDFDVAWEKVTGIKLEDMQDGCQLLGWPDVIQGNMFVECELVSKGYYLGDGWSNIPKDIRQQAREIAHDKWQLLLQLDTIECGDFYLMFGDCGHIYFYITKEDLEARHFERAWLILQCC